MSLETPKFSRFSQIQQVCHMIRRPILQQPPKHPIRARKSLKMGAKTRGKRLQVGNSTRNKSLKKVAI